MPRAELDFFNDRNAKSASAVILAYLLAGNTILTGRQIGRLTGMSRSGVVTAIALLTARGWLVKHPAGYRLNAGMSPLFARPRAQLSTGYPQVINNDIKWSTEQTTPAVSGLLSRPPQNEPTSPARARPLDHDDHDHDDDELIKIKEELAALGFLEPAQWLAQHEPGLVAAWLDYVSEHQPAIKSPGAYLRRAVESGHRPASDRPEACPQCGGHYLSSAGECLKCAGLIES